MGKKIVSLRLSDEAFHNLEIVSQRFEVTRSEAGRLVLHAGLACLDAGAQVEPRRILAAIEYTQAGMDALLEQHLPGRSDDLMRMVGARYEKRDG